MITKIYQATIQLTLPVMVEGKPVYVTFSEEKNTYCTADPKMQAALEAMGEFNKKFRLKSTIGTMEEKKPSPTPAVNPAIDPSKPVDTNTQVNTGEGAETDEKAPKGDENPNTQTSTESSGTENPAPAVNSVEGETKKEYPEVTDFQAAREILRKEYGIAHQSLTKPENILKKATEVGVSFPNLTI